jgi:hypothetical protein
MASDDIRQEAIRELARRELAKRKADPIGTAVRKVAGQQAGDEDPLAYRGSILPLGRTKEGSIVPAIPAPFVEGARLVKGAATKGQMATPEEAFGPASLGVGGSPAIRGGRGGLPAVTKPEVLSTGGLGEAKTAAYDASEAAGVGILPEQLKGFVESLLPGMKDAGINKGLHPQAWAFLEHMVDQAGLGKPKPKPTEGLEALIPSRTPDQPITLKELDQLRQLARENITPSSKETEVRVNSIIIDKIDDFILGLKDNDTTGGGTKEGVSKLFQARELALRKSKAEDIDKALELSISKAGEYRASGMENAWRSEFKKIYDREIKKPRSKYSPEELEALKDAGTTKDGQRGLISLGKLSPTAGAMGLLTAATSGELAMYLQQPWMLALPIGAQIARYAATKMRENSARSVEELVKGGRPISDYRFQQALRTRGRINPRAGIIGGAGLLPQPQQQQPDQFNPLLNPGAT